MKRAMLCAMFLSACSDQAIIDAAYPDREKFAFRSLDNESIFSYTCASDATSEATKARATEAHAYLDQRFNAAVDRAADALAKSASQKQARASTKALDTEIADIVEQTEARYLCLFIDARDV